jgi:hypothetical protein
MLVGTVRQEFSNGRINAGLVSEEEVAGLLPQPQLGRRNALREQPGVVGMDHAILGAVHDERRVRDRADPFVSVMAERCGELRRVGLGLDRVAQPLCDVLGDAPAAVAARPGRVVVGAASSAGIWPRRWKNASVSASGATACLPPGVVAANTRPSTRSGCRNAISWAIIPPSETP